MVYMLLDHNRAVRAMSVKRVAVWIIMMSEMAAHKDPEAETMAGFVVMPAMMPMVSVTVHVVMVNVVSTMVDVMSVSGMASMMVLRTREDCRR